MLPKSEKPVPMLIILKDHAVDHICAHCARKPNRGLFLQPHVESKQVRLYLHPPYWSQQLTYNGRDNFQAAVAGLENARFGVAFSSGTAAVAMILLTLASGSHVVSVADLYGGTKEFFTSIAVSHGIKISFTNNLDEELPALIRPNETKLVWIETPSNPTLQVVDIRKAANTAAKYDAQVVVDNTFLSPFIQNPMDLGASIVLHSATKYINGHSVREETSPHP
jgi:cystathionine beta-lyase/cystathionine gamma-synthase